MERSEFKVLGENILLEVMFENDDVTSGGIIIPDTAKDKDSRCLRARVHGVGPKVDTDDINCGDVVRFLNFGVHPVDVRFEDDPDGVYCLVNQLNVCGVEYDE